jgi:hypothetical protein
VTRKANKFRNIQGSGPFLSLLEGKKTSSSCPVTEGNSEVELACGARNLLEKATASHLRKWLVLNDMKKRR